MVRGRLALDSDFFSRKRMRPTLFIFLAAVQGFRAMEGTNETDAKAWEWTATRSARRGMFSIGFSFVSSSRGRRGWEMEPISARIFFLPFLSSFGWTSKR